MLTQQESDTVDTLEQLAVHATSLYTAASTIRMLRDCLDSAESTLKLASARVAFLEGHQYKDRFWIGVVTPLLVIMFFGVADSLPWKSDGIKYPVAMQSGAFLVLVFIGGAAIGSLIAGLITWKPPKAEA